MSGEATAVSTRQQRLQHNSAERRAQKKLDLRQSMLSAATALFERDGFEGFSLRQVAEAIGYSPTSIYLYFRDKEDLLHHVALEGFRSFGQDLQQAADLPGSAQERLNAIGLAYLRFGLRRPLHYRLMFMVRGDWLGLPTPSGYDSVIDSFGVLEQAVQLGMESGELKGGDVQVYTSFLWSNVHGLVSLHLATPYFPAEILEELYRQHQEMIGRSLSS